MGIDSIMPEELNVIHYACPARSLLKRYERKSGDVP